MGGLAGLKRHIQSCLCRCMQMRPGEKLSNIGFEPRRGNGRRRGRRGVECREQGKWEQPATGRKGVVMELSAIQMRMYRRRNPPGTSVHNEIFMTSPALVHGRKKSSRKSRIINHPRIRPRINNVFVLRISLSDLVSGDDHARAQREAAWKCRRNEEGGGGEG